MRTKLPLQTLLVALFSILMITDYATASTFGGRTFKVGDYIEIDGYGGVVFAVSADGKSGKAVSTWSVLDEWGSVKRLISRGAHWQLASKSDMIALNGSLEIVNKTLTSIAEMEMRKQLYWTIDECDSSTEAWAVHLGESPSVKALDKNERCQSRCVASFSVTGPTADAIASDAVGYTYKVGDYVELKGIPCVVFLVWNKGKNAKVVSLEEFNCDRSWARTSCWALGIKIWDLPNNEELKAIYAQKDVINNTLNWRSATPLSAVNYWGSTGTDEFSFYIDMQTGVLRPTVILTKKYAARAVALISAAKQNTTAPVSPPAN